MFLRHVGRHTGVPDELSSFKQTVVTAAKVFAIAFVQLRQKWTAFTFAQWPFSGVCEGVCVIELRKE